jgi:glutaredoxin 3
MGLLGGTVSAAGRTLGHWLSLGTTGIMMGLVLWFIHSKAKLRKQKRGATFWHVWGPTILVAIAATCIMAEPFRHIFQDMGWWEECGDNAVFPRVNETFGDADICRWSSSQYKCERLCYVPGDWTQNCGPGDAGCGGEIDLTDPVYKIDLYNESATVDENILMLGCMNGTVTVDGVETPFLVWDLKDKDGEYFSPYDEEAIEKAGYEGWINCPEGSACGQCVNEDDFCHCTDHEDFGNLSMIGWIFTFTLTYLGFFILTTGVMWNADIVNKLAKIKSQYRALRDPEYRRKLKEEAKGEVIYVRETVADNTVVMFSKTTCPFCYKAKEALNAEMGEGTYFVVELDEKENTSAIQDALKIVTGARTVPRVFINQECIGGGDDTVAKHKSGELKELLRKAGATV